MIDKQTSDERLLKLIEEQKGPLRRQGLPGFAKKPFAGIFPGKLNLKSLQALKDFKPNFFILNRGLFGFSALLTLIFIFTIFSGPKISKSTAAYFNATDAAAVSKIISAIQKQGLMRKTILGQKIKKNIFLSRDSQANAYDLGEAASLEEQAKDLKLVGIIWSASPEVMIENTRELRTYLLKRGDTLNNELIKLKSISRNSATLEITTDNGPKDYELK